VPLYAKFFFQLVFAGTAATIVSGAVAERIKFGSFVLFSFILVAFIYSVGGHWAWGGGWLSRIGFLDFAGSTVVHSIGGWAALAGVMILGPRIGKYLPNGKVNPIPGHNMTSATLGALILWLGWFGFNPGSTMAADPNAIATIALNTNMAAAAGCLSATAAAWVLLGKPDLSMIINGTLAGLVAITAGCSVVGVGSSLVIGSVAGVLVVYAVLFFDKVKLDDPVGALSVHLVNGVFGTLAVGLFAADGGLFFGGGFGRTVTQLIGIGAVGVTTFALSAVAWLALKATVGIRVSKAEELEGLDTGEHGMEAYAGFVQAPRQSLSAEVI
jgi:Amt family ammonium transporter